MWYFAYGSDLHRHSVADWCKHAQRPLPRRDEVLPAVLSNYRLCFPAYETFWKGGTADIVPAAGKSVGGALIRVSSLGLDTLERMAGRACTRHGRDSGIRKRVCVKVSPHGGPAIDAVTFQMIARGDYHIPPTDVYMDRLVHAAVEIGLSTMWVMHLQSFDVRRPAVRFEPPAPPLIVETPMAVAPPPPRESRWVGSLVRPSIRRPRRELELATTA